MQGRNAIYRIFENKNLDKVKLNISLTLSQSAKVKLRLYDAFDMTLKSNEFKCFFDETVVAKLDKDQVSGENNVFLEINNPKLWSAEIPNLYTLYIEIYDGDNLLEVTSVKIGIRLFEKNSANIMTLNGKRIVFAGVDSYHERKQYQCYKNKPLSKLLRTI